MHGVDLQSKYLFSGEQVSEEQVIDPAQERMRALSGTPDERAQYTLDVPIAVDEYRMATAYLAALLKRAAISKRPGGLWIIGSGGQGKTFILERLLKRLKPQETEFKRHCPVLFLRFEARPSQSEIYIRLLLQLGQDPRSLRSMPIPTLKTTLKKAIATAGVLLIAFDEAQHLWVMSSSRKNDEAGGTIGAAVKLLYDETGVAFVFLGTPPLDEVRRRDDQTTRWPGVVRLKEFLFDSSFLGLLAAIDECLPLPSKSNLLDPKLSQEIFESCKGNFRLLKNLLSEAVRLTCLSGETCISRQHLAKSHFLVHCSEETPFGRP